MKDVTLNIYSYDYLRVFSRFESSQKTLLSLKQELKTLTEMHEILQKHNESLKQQHDL